VPENTKSSSEPIAFWNVSVELMMNGASGEVPGMRDDDPMCMHTTVSVSWHAANIGSHLPEWIDGNPSGYGFSENVMAWLPLAAQRRTSSAARSASHSGTMVSGMSRPLASPAHHSSIIQSL
jgi:hypothetical protein